MLVETTYFPFLLIPRVHLNGDVSAANCVLGLKHTQRHNHHSHIIWSNLNQSKWNYMLNALMNIGDTKYLQTLLHALDLNRRCYISFYVYPTKYTDPLWNCKLFFQLIIWGIIVELELLWTPLYIDLVSG